MATPQPELERHDPDTSRERENVCEINLQHLEPTHPDRAVAELLARPQARIRQEFLYDDRGCELYDGIVQTPEYYLPRAESALLADRVVESLTGSPQENVVVELGAGASERSYCLVAAVGRGSERTVYVPGDICSSALSQNRSAFERQFDGQGNFAVAPEIGTHDTCLAAVAASASAAAQRSFVYLGSSLGNLDDEESVGLLSLVRSYMRAGDRFLMGLDRAPHAGKSVARVQAAYNDAAGYTAAFTLNALSHVNRVAGLDFDEGDWQHIAEYDPRQRAVLTYVEARRSCTVSSRASGALRSFEAGERIFMEQSRKYELPQVAEMARRAGLSLAAQWVSEDYLVVELRSDAQPDPETGGVGENRIAG